MRMRRVKRSVLQNREFLSGLNDIFQQVEHSYGEQIKLLKKSHRYKVNSKVPSVANNGKTVSVFISANTGLYGEIIKKTFNLFMTDIAKTESDIFIIGRLGKRMYEDAGMTNAYTFFDIVDSGSNEKNIKEIFSKLIEYKNIIVYHGLFKDMLVQIATKSYIAREILSTERSDNETTVECIFEPSLENIVTFFETQILGALFEQSIFESDLSKYASRMISLDVASVNISNRLKMAYFNSRKAVHRKINSKQITLLSGISLWGNQ
jgi:F0F1-type ATP synthase gamma subunit